MNVLLLVCPARQGLVRQVREELDSCVGELQAAELPEVSAALSLQTISARQPAQPKQTGLHLAPCFISAYLLE